MKKLLMLDIETAPNLATVWGLFKQNISINQLIDSSYTLCWAAKWYREDGIMFDSVHKSSPKRMLKGVHKLLAEADAVCHYNGTRFDIPTLNKEFVLHGLAPPAPFKQIDLLKTTRNVFRFPSNKLDYVAQALGLGKKYEHKGHELFLQCMNKDEEAWKEMQAYNEQDVVLLERLYDRLLPWIKGHPSRSLHEGEEICPKCGSKEYTKRGWAFTSAGKYQRYECKSCHTWFRGTKNEAARIPRFVELTR